MPPPEDYAELISDAFSIAARILAESAGQPALLTFGEVTTMFHEFGHGLHALFSKVKYPYMSGTNTPRDFV